MIEVSYFWFGVIILFLAVAFFSVHIAFIKMNKFDISEMKNEIRVSLVNQIKEDLNQYYFQKYQNQINDSDGFNETDEDASHVLTMEEMKMPEMNFSDGDDNES